MSLLVNSTQDNVMLGMAVQESFIELCGAYLRINKVKLIIPDYLKRAIFIWREMCVRHKSGDIRHTEDEMKAMKEIADWTVRVNQELRNQKQKPVQWR